MFAAAASFLAPEAQGDTSLSIEFPQFDEFYNWEDGFNWDNGAPTPSCSVTISDRYHDEGEQVPVLVFTNSNVTIADLTMNDFGLVELYATGGNFFRLGHD